MLVEFGKANWIDKARQQPDKVQQVLEKVRTDGFLTTLDAVQSKLDQPLPLGYCNVGVVAAVGEGVSSFSWVIELLLMALCRVGCCAAPITVIPDDVCDGHVSLYWAQ